MQRALLELLSSHGALALAATDLEGRITFATPAFRTIAGGSLRPASGDGEPSAFTGTVYDSTGRRALDLEELAHLRARRGHVVVDQTSTVRRPDGQLTYLRFNAAPLRELNGDIRGAITLVQDVTMEWSVVLRQAELRDRLVTTVNHELRTPMTIIIGHAEILADALDEIPEPLRQSVEAIATASHKLAAMAHTITNLADLERTASGVGIHRVLGDLTELLRDVAEGRRAAAAAAGLSLTLVGEPSLECEIDEKHVRRAVGELLDNAIALAPSGSEITVGVLTGDGLIEVVVTDHGPGIRTQDRHRLLHPFERGAHVDPSDSSPGLGLAIANAVATAHGGSLLLQDNDPVGLVARLGLGQCEPDVS